MSSFPDKIIQIIKDNLNKNKNDFTSDLKYQSFDVSSNKKAQLNKQLQFKSVLSYVEYNENKEKNIINDEKYISFNEYKNKINTNRSSRSNSNANDCVNIINHNNLVEEEKTETNISLNNKKTSLMKDTDKRDSNIKRERDNRFFNEIENNNTSRFLLRKSNFQEENYTGSFNTNSSNSNDSDSKVMLLKQKINSIRNITHLNSISSNINSSNSSNNSNNSSDNENTLINTGNSNRNSNGVNNDFNISDIGKITIVFALISILLILIFPFALLKSNVNTNSNDDAIIKGNSYLLNELHEAEKNVTFEIYNNIVRPFTQTSKGINNKNPSNLFDANKYENEQKSFNSFFVDEYLVRDYLQNEINKKIKYEESSYNYSINNPKRELSSIQHFQDNDNYIGYNNNTYPCLSNTNCDRDSNNHQVIPYSQISNMISKLMKDNYDTESKFSNIANHIIHNINEDYEIKDKNIRSLTNIDSLASNEVSENKSEERDTHNTVISKTSDNQKLININTFQLNDNLSNVINKFNKFTLLQSLTTQKLKGTWDFDLLSNLKFFDDNKNTDDTYSFINHFKTISPLMNHDSTGCLKLKLSKKAPTEYSLNMLIFDGEYMDRWLKIDAICNEPAFEINNININRDKNNEVQLVFSENNKSCFHVKKIDESNDKIKGIQDIYLTSSFTGVISKGKSFSLSSSETMNIEMSFYPKLKVKGNTKTLDLSSELLTNFSGQISFTQNNIKILSLNFDIEPTLSDIEDEPRIYIYCLLMLILSLMKVKDSMNILKKISITPGHATNISLLGLGSNIVWGTVYCLLNINLTTSYSKLNTLLAIPTVLFVANYGWFEIRILIKCIEIQHSSNLTPQALRKTISLFFMKLYLIMFLSMYFFTYFLVNEYFITINVLLLWIPQIIVNVYSNSRLSFPLSHLLTNTLLRVFFICYIRGFTLNIFKLEPKIYSVAFIVLLSLLEILVIYSQAILGARWFIPVALKDIKFKYLTFEELQKRERYKTDSDCIICLSPFSEDVNFNTDTESGDNHNNDNASNYTNLSHNTNISQGSNKSMFILSREEIVRNFFYNDIKKSWSEFHRFEFNIYKQEFVETDCSHLFHTVCLEKWLIQRRECPSCRSVSMME